MGSRQITRLPSASGTPLTAPGSYPPALNGWLGSGRRSLSQRRAWSSATSTRTGTGWRWHWPIPAARSAALERSSPAMATCPWSLSTPMCGDGVSATSCCRDFTSVHPKEAGAARRYGPGRRTRALDAYTKARDIEGQAMRRPLAAVIPSSSSSVKHPDPRRSVEDGSAGTLGPGYSAFRAHRGRHRGVGPVRQRGMAEDNRLGIVIAVNETSE